MQPNMSGMPYGVIQQPPMIIPPQMQNPMMHVGVGGMPFGVFPSMGPQMGQVPALRPPTVIPIRPAMLGVGATASTSADYLNAGKAPGVKPSSADDSNSVFVGHISPDVEDEFLRCLLQECGQIVKWNRPPDPITNRLASFGFCQFESPQGVLFATRILHNINLEGKQLMVKANEKSQAAMEKWKIERRDLIRQHQAMSGQTPDEIKDLDEELNKEEERARKVIYERVEERKKQYHQSLGGDERTVDGQNKASLVESEIAAFRCSLIYRERHDDSNRPLKDEEESSAVSKHYRESWREREREQHFWEKERLADKEFMRREREAEKDEERRISHRKRMFERIEDDGRHRRRQIHRELKESSENEKWRSTFYQNERRRKRDRERKEDILDIETEEAEEKARFEAELKAVQDTMERELEMMTQEDRSVPCESKVEEVPSLKELDLGKVELGFSIPTEKKVVTPKSEVSAVFGDTFIEEETKPKHRPLQKLENLLDRGNIKAASQMKQQQLEQTKKIVSALPTSKETAKEIEIDWDFIFEKQLLPNKLHSWIQKKANDFFGEDVETKLFVEHVLKELNNRCTIDALWDKVDAILEDDGAFVLQLWRTLLFEAWRAKEDAIREEAKKEEARRQQEEEFAKSKMEVDTN